MLRGHWTGVQPATLASLGLSLDMAGALLLTVPLLTTRRRATQRAMSVLEREKELQRLIREEGLSFPEANMRVSGSVDRRVRDARIGAAGAFLLAFGFLLQLTSLWL